MNPPIYVESSAILAWLLGEADGERVATCLEAAQQVTASALTQLEAERHIVRRMAAGACTEAQAIRLKGALSREAARWSVIDIAPEILARAARPFPLEPVRSLDAIHLATALELLTAFPDLEILSLDRRVIDNARALGLPVTI